MSSAANIATAADVNAAILEHWAVVCGEFPNATTPQISRKVAEDFGVSVARIFDAFPAGSES